jgi:hypothetical protein
LSSTLFIRSNLFLIKEILKEKQDLGDPYIHFMNELMGICRQKEQDALIQRKNMF